MNTFKKKICVFLIFTFLLSGCGYKLGGLEVIGENSSKTAVLEVHSSKFIIQKFKSAGFTIDSDNFEYLIKVEGPFRKKETSSVTSDADDREFTLTSTTIVSIYNKSGEAIIESKKFSKSRDYSFSSANINSSSSEEKIIFLDIEQILLIEVVNILRSII
tara:strand:+ start:591 stop:1070 length:480 start_codon:yes stop_codon:yes gene_type:complete